MVSTVETSVGVRGKAGTGQFEEGSLFVRLFVSLFRNNKEPPLADPMLLLCCSICAVRVFQSSLSVRGMRLYSYVDL